MFKLWTITRICSDGLHTFLEFETQKEVLEHLEELETNGQNMDYVNVFPPMANIEILRLI